MADFPKAARWHVSTKQRIRARSLRVNSTDTERIIWSALRGHRMNGATFRRQTPIGPYIVDFVCHAAKLVIEIDGGQHFESRQEQRDARRDAYLANKGFRVLRFQQSRCHDQPRGRSRNDCSCRRPCPLPDPPAEVGFIRLRPVNTRRTRVNPSSDASGGGDASGARAAPTAGWEHANRRRDRRP